ncbi:hypothetical protein [Kingella kingae]|uniref:hypothetical protein n=1 Tax=Kingella kingae TaxID=504 RepID=UPI00254B2349|nr:hypothetical protein [Kingella kingae]MDK4573770.1 hypothetical protein [Kingella kingae]MDK4605961.1 hypothetical protein [Kingella kingae]
MMILFLLMILALIAASVGYFKAACTLSVAEKWLTDFADLRAKRKNIALTRRLMSVVFNRATVQNPRLLRPLRMWLGIWFVVLLGMEAWLVALNAAG